MSGEHLLVIEDHRALPENIIFKLKSVIYHLKVRTMIMSHFLWIVWNIYHIFHYKQCVREQIVSYAEFHEFDDSKIQI